MNGAMERAEAIAAMCESGMTLADIGALLGISYQRVGQLRDKAGPVTMTQRTYSVTAVMAAVRDARCWSWPQLARMSGHNVKLLRQVLQGLDRLDAAERLLRMRRRHRRHGTRRGYYLGCRCERCRAANYAHQKACYARRDAGAVTHGLASTYTNYDCRCESCRVAYRAYQRRYRGRYYTRKRER